MRTLVDIAQNVTRSLCVNVGMVVLPGMAAGLMLITGGDYVAPASCTALSQAAA
jgi:hypothetical protein